MADRKLIPCMMFLLLSGCGAKRDEDPSRFSEVYASLLERALPAEEIDSVAKKLFSITCDRMPVQDFFRWLSDASGVSVIYSQDVDGSLITCEIKNQDVDSIIEFVSRRLGRQVVKGGAGLFFVGDVRPEDRGVLVRQVPRLQAKDIKAAVQTLFSEQGRATVLDDGLAIVADRIETLTRVNVMLDQIEQATADTWIVQLYYLQSRDDNDVNVGIDFNHAAKISYEANRVRTEGFSASVLLDAQLVADRTEQHSRVVARPLLLLVDGRESKLHTGERIPIARKSVSGEGTVTTSGYDYVETGLNITAQIRHAGAGRARLDLTTSLGSVVGYIDEAPITQQAETEISAYLQSGGVYLVGSLSMVTNDRSNAGPLVPLKFGRSRQATEIEIWAKSYRIQGEADHAEPPTQ